MLNFSRTKYIKMYYIGCLILVATVLLTGIYLGATVKIEALMEAGYYRDIAIDVMGMLVGNVLILGLIAEDREDKINRAMFRLVFTLIILFFTDLLSSYMEGNPNLVLEIKLVNTSAFVLENILSYCYWSYISKELKLEGKFYRMIDGFCLGVLGITAVSDLFNWKFGYYFTITSAGEYVDAPLEYVGDLAIIAIFIIALIVIIRNKETSIKEKLILLSFESFPVAAYIIGGITQEYAWTFPAYLLSVLLIYIRIFSKRGKKLAEQQVLLTKQSTALMISQIQPHFLYNVLTTISNLCATDPEEAEETTVLFSQYLRTNLDSLRNEDAVPFSMELGHIKTYVELEKKRFGDKLNVEYDIREVNFKVPSLGLQPIVENSIKHGIRGKNAPGHIKISTEKTNGGYLIVIEDDGIGFDMNMPAKEDGRSHVGMTNVRERLKQMCHATMKIESSPGNGCRTEIYIPEDS